MPRHDAFTRATISDTVGLSPTSTRRGCAELKQPATFRNSSILSSFDTRVSTTSQPENSALAAVRAESKITNLVVLYVAAMSASPLHSAGDQLMVSGAWLTAPPSTW